MRILIAAGGTGGHIYPALAVARSLRARPDAPELGWLGGHRGLEATLIPPTGIDFRRLAVRSLRTTDMDVHAVMDPIRLALSVPQATAILAAQRPAAVFTTGGYMAMPVLMAAAPLLTLGGPWWPLVALSGPYQASSRRLSSSRWSRITRGLSRANQSPHRMKISAPSNCRRSFGIVLRISRNGTATGSAFGIAMSLA